MILQRRKFITGLASLIAAPAIVKVSGLMPIRGVPLNTISMRKIIEYIPGDYNITSYDICYSHMFIKPEWVTNIVNEITGINEIIKI